MRGTEMGAGKAVSHLIWASLLSAVWIGGAIAADKPDGMSLLKKHPEFATLQKITSLPSGNSVVHITLCRHSRGGCELFEGESAQAGALADYAYLYAIYKGKYAPGDSAKSKADWLAEGLLQEANDKGYGEALLGYYSAEEKCAGTKDSTACVLHKLYGSIRIQRYIVERDDAGGVTLLTADEDGKGDPFEG